LASIVFNMDSPSVVLPWPGGAAVPGSNPRTREISDAFLNIVPTPAGLVVECTYDRSLFDRRTIEGHVDEWLRLVDAVTRDPTQSIEIQVARDPFVGASGAGRIHVPLTNDLERLVAGMWSELLEVEVESAADDLFELGGNSLDLIRFHTRVHERYGVAPAIGDLFASPTVGAVADAVAEAILEAEFDGDVSALLGEPRE
jgi:acyl carrier protein